MATNPETIATSDEFVHSMLKKDGSFEKAFDFVKRKNNLKLFLLDELDRISALDVDDNLYLVMTPYENVFTVLDSDARRLEVECRDSSLWLTKLRMEKHIEAALLDLCERYDLILVPCDSRMDKKMLMKKGTTIEELCIQNDLESDSRHDKFF